MMDKQRNQIVNKVPIVSRPDVTEEEVYEDGERRPRAGHLQQGRVDAPHAAQR